MKTTNSMKIERINNNLDKSWKEFSYKDKADLFNTYKLLLNWLLEKEEMAIDIIYNASAIDRLDFFSSTSFALIKILNDDIMEWQEQMFVKQIDKNYIMCKGVVISIHNTMLAKLTGIMIAYMLECKKADYGNVICFSKVA